MIACLAWIKHDFYHLFAKLLLKRLALSAKILSLSLTISQISANFHPEVNSG
jgi:hypothetical protein